jgi:hydroxyethylthiazole kinase-like uncharacterized protein yjeF
MPDAISPPHPEPAERVITAAEASAADRAAMASGLSIDRLMDAAGRAVATVAREMLAQAARPDRPVAILCGPGGNGGDGYVAARVLAGWGLPVRLHAARAPSPDTAAARALAHCGVTVEPLGAYRPDEAALVIDALYGAGLARGLDGPDADALAATAWAGVPVLAVDLPSGLDADSGQPLGPVCPATRTVSFFRRKPAHLLWPGRQLCGAVTVADIGLTDDHLAVEAGGGLWRNHPALWSSLLDQQSAAGAHKYQRGHVHVVSGPPLHTGASRLSAQAALHAGAGAVTLHGGHEALMVHAAHVTAVMLAQSRPVELARDVATRAATAIVIGPALGLDAAATAWLDAAMGAPAPLVLDADAITLLAKHFEALPMRRQALPHAASVLTPHAGEFARLFGERLAADGRFATLPARLQRSKVEQARAAARLSDAVVVFKGPDTVIAAPDGRAAIHDEAGPELATAGSGDVLAGIIAAHLAAGHAAFEAAAAAVWLHGAAGAAFGAGLTAERLIAMLRPLPAFL